MRTPSPHLATQTLNIRKEALLQKLVRKSLSYKDERVAFTIWRKLSLQHRESQACKMIQAHLKHLISNRRVQERRIVHEHELKLGKAVDSALTRIYSYKAAQINHVCLRVLVEETNEKVLLSAHKV